MENKDWGESPLLDIIQLLDSYQNLAVRTAAPVEGGDVEKALFGAIALAGESGEILDYMKKVKYHGHDFNLGKFLDEVGDQLWFVIYSKFLCLIWLRITLRNLREDILRELSLPKGV